MDTAENLQNIPVEEPNELGFFERLINIFTNPRKTFESIDRNPTWIWPMVIIILLTAVTTQIMFPTIMQSQLDNIRNNSDIPQEQLQMIERQMTENVTMQRIFALGGQLIATPLVYLLLAAIYFFVGSVLLGGDTSYKKVLSMLSWSGCISIVATIVLMPLVMIKKSLNISLSPALFMSGDSVESKLYVFLSKLDFFTIWYLIVVAIGFSVIYKFGKAKAFIAVGFLWAIWIAISVAFAGFFSRFGM